ncbi:MAG TPA: DUF2891 domain-containing protein [Candidatus Eisenbacteria bacterium]
MSRLILAALHREYPNQIQHRLESDADARPPRQLTPAFFGSYDWHSAVHGHWALVRLLRLFPGSGFEAHARAALARSFIEETLGAELAYLRAPGREAFERPYGLAWLLQLAAELREWDDPEAAIWRVRLAPLEALAAERLENWLAKLPGPIRSGVHSQTAFALGLAHDWARTAGSSGLASQIEARARGWHGADVAAPIGYEPSAHDFLSPIWGEADLMRRVLSPGEYAPWLERFLPDLESPMARRWLAPVASPDPADGHLAHLDGLNLSRAWMLEAVAASLPPAEPRQPALREAAARHAEVGLDALTGEHYTQAHWLGSFAVYLLTRRGLG